MLSNITDCWYRRALHPYLLPLVPLSWLFACGVKWRRWLYRRGLLKTANLPVPVIVVGNINVGGTGKTPLVIALAQLLRAHGYQPGIISRGYGGRKQREPCVVLADSSPSAVGDEAILLAQKADCPVVVSVDRVAAARKLLELADCNIIISDDGLQHYRLPRAIEIVVVDGERRFGNHYVLPAGPLRESISRLHEVDFVVMNGGDVDTDYAFTLEPERVVALTDATRYMTLPALAQTTFHAVAGIGHPERFFTLLRHSDLSFSAHAFPDHHAYVADDLDFQDELPILMTEKDAVKCKSFADQRYWYLCVRAELNAKFREDFLTHITSLQPMVPLSRLRERG